MVGPNVTVTGNATGITGVVITQPISGTASPVDQGALDQAPQTTDPNSPAALFAEGSILRPSGAGNSPSLGLFTRVQSLSLVGSIMSRADDGFAARLHDEWRSTRKIQEGEGKAVDGQPLREARWKGVKSDDPCLAVIPELFRRFRVENGQNMHEVDIANLDYQRLPAKFKFENAEASKGAIKIIRDAISEQEGRPEITIDLEAASEIIHQQWLDRNGSWAPAEQNKPYSELAEIEKAKDRVIIEGAIDHVNKEFAEIGILTRIIFQR